MQATIKKVQVECGKCNGKGNIQAFRHIEKGDCFWCNGSGKIWVAESEVVTSVEIDADLESRRCRFFENLTIEQYDRLHQQKKDSLHKWAADKEFKSKAIYNRYMDLFQPAYLVARRMYWLKEGCPKWEK